MKFLTSVLFFCFTTTAFGFQNISVGFKSDSLSVSRSSKEVNFYIELEQPVFQNAVDTIKVELTYGLQESDFPRSGFTLNRWQFTLKELRQIPEGNPKFFMTLKPDDHLDKTRVLVLNLSLKSGTEESVKLENAATFQKLKIYVQPYKKPNSISAFDNLAYIGTNFDLAGGKIESQKLFFASNILKRPNTPNNKTGFYLSIYGNRAMTQSDSSRTRTFTRFSPLTDTTYRSVTVRNSMLIESATDNIGAYISPLFNVKKFNKDPDNDNQFALFYAPSLEFVWRRTTQVITYKELERDSLIVEGDIPRNSISFPPERLSQTFNEYAFNAGILGLFLMLENDNLSVRVHGSVGYSSTYTPTNSDPTQPYNFQGDIFFSGRAWITEASTGLTLQAEVNNAYNNPRPLFIATISKAISFKDLSGIFKPISSR